MGGVGMQDAAPWAATAAELRTWLCSHALPLWLEHGVDRKAGAFVEFLRPGHHDCDAAFRRLRVAARQTWVFSQAHVEGVPGADAAVELGIDFLTRHASLPSGGYARLFDCANQPTDLTLDLYEHAFVLLALSGAASVLPQPRLRERALALEAFIGRAFAHPRLGYLESVPPALPRRQNPHMHLLEALLAAHAAFGDQPFLARARGVAALFLARFYDPATGALAEFFDDDLRPLHGDAGVSVEPGHHCEWVWLLHEFVAVAGPDADLARAAKGLMAFVGRHGLHPVTGDVIDGVAGTGAAPVLTARLWPQTEMLRAAFVRADASEAGRTSALARLSSRLLPSGLWHERRDAAGDPLPGPVPASSLYHLVGGILTASRLG
jgi:mannose/cellobiose epimerase-like protein (N-acyl-D-glucosamine 2-epimerase family)